MSRENGQAFVSGQLFDSSSRDCFPSSGHYIRERTMDHKHFIGNMLHIYIIYLNKLLICMCIYMLVSLCTKLYMITCVNVEDCGSTEGYCDSFREDEGDEEFR